MRRHAAFSLVELSIVLVIIGLLIGGILAGKSMIRQSELRSIITQKDALTQAIYAFRDKYLAMPGEFYEYKRVWPQMVGTYCYGPTLPGMSNKNGVIDNGFERENALAQLYAAGLVPNGRPQILQDGTVRDTWDCFENNMQQDAGLTTKFGSVYAMFDPTIAATVGISVLQYGDAYTPVMTVDEAYAMDLKLDDGLPAWGRIMNSRTTASGYCTSSNWGTLSTSVTYDTSSMNSKTCYTRIILK